MQAPNPRTPSFFGLCKTQTPMFVTLRSHSKVLQHKFSCLWLQDHPWRFRLSAPLMTGEGSNFYNTGSWDSSRNNTDRRHKRAFGYKTLDLQKRHKMHSNLSKKLLKPHLGLAYNVLYILEKTACDLGFKRISYGIFTFADTWFWIDRTNQLVTHLFLSQTWVFCLGLQYRPF